MPKHRNNTEKLIAVHSRFPESWQPQIDAKLEKQRKKLLKYGVVDNSSLIRWRVGEWLEDVE